MADEAKTQTENKKDVSLSENELEQVAGGLSIVRKTGDEDDVYDLEIQRLKLKKI